MLRQLSYDFKASLHGKNLIYREQSLSTSPTLECSSSISLLREPRNTIILKEKISDKKLNPSINWTIHNAMHQYRHTFHNNFNKVKQQG